MTYLEHAAAILERSRVSTTPVQQEPADERNGSSQTSSRATNKHPPASGDRVSVTLWERFDLFPFVTPNPRLVLALQSFAKGAGPHGAHLRALPFPHWRISVGARCPALLSGRATAHDPRGAGLPDGVHRLRLRRRLALCRRLIDGHGAALYALFPPPFVRHTPDPPGPRSSRHCHQRCRGWRYGTQAPAGRYPYPPAARLGDGARRRGRLARARIRRLSRRHLEHRQFRCSHLVELRLALPARCRAATRPG